MLTARQYGEVVLTDAASGQGPGALAIKLSRCKEGMARVFAVQVQSLLHTGAVAVQGQLSGRKVVSVAKSDKWALAQCRGKICLGARNLSWCRILIAGRCACPGATAITNLSWEQVQKLRSVATKPRLGGRKNRDKQLTHIVRVIGRCYCFIVKKNQV